MRNGRTIRYIEKTLRAANEPLTTLEIHERICSNWPRTASSSSAIGNLLSRHKQFVKMDYCVDYYYAGGSKPIHVWDLSKLEQVI